MIRSRASHGARCSNATQERRGPRLTTRTSSTNSCNAVFPLIGQIPDENKDLVLTHDRRQRRAALSSDHGVCAAGGPQFGDPNAYDWNFCWKVWDALRDCAIDEIHCNYALGDTRRHRSMGRWSDGTPVARLKVRDAPPILLETTAPIGETVARWASTATRSCLGSSTPPAG